MTVTFRVRLATLGVAALLVGTTAPAGAVEVGWAGPRSSGQRLYVPVYSSVRFLEGWLVDLAGTVSIRNTDAARPIRVEAVRYFGNDGMERGEPFAAPGVLGPMASAAPTACGDGRMAETARTISSVRRMCSPDRLWGRV